MSAPATAVHRSDPDRVAATVVWVLYRLIKGWLALLEGSAPTTYA